VQADGDPLNGRSENFHTQNSVIQGGFFSTGFVLQWPVGELGNSKVKSTLLILNGFHNTLISVHRFMPSMIHDFH